MWDNTGFEPPSYSNSHGCPSELPEHQLPLEGRHVKLKEVQLARTQVRKMEKGHNLEVAGVTVIIQGTQVDNVEFNVVRGCGILVRKSRKVIYTGGFNEGVNNPTLPTTVAGSTSLAFEGSFCRSPLPHPAGVNALEPSSTMIEVRSTDPEVAANIYDVARRIIADAQSNDSGNESPN